VAAVLLAVAGCGGGDDDSETSSAGTASVAPTTTRVTTPADGKLAVVVDTDLAADDLVALSYLGADPRVELLAVTVTGTGEVRCPRGADVARGLLATMDLADVPAACGRSQPLSGDRVFPDEWRTAADNGWGLVLPVVAGPAEEPDAVELLTDVITSAASPVTLLALGPLTNVAEAIDARPDLLEHLSRVVVMGGAIDVPGNVEPEGAAVPLAAEWNLYIDPEAAAAVVASGVPLTLVALDATNAVPVTEDMIERLAVNDVTDATRRVRQLFERYPPPFLWDPLAAIAVTDPELVPVAAANVTVVTEGDESGRTVVDADGTPIEVAGPPDAEVVLDHLLRTLAGVGEGEQLAVPTTLPVLGEVTVGFDGSTCAYGGPATIAAGAYRVTLLPADVPFAVVVAPLLGEATLDEVLAWIDEHPDEEPPMVGEAAFLAPDNPNLPESLVFAPGRVGIVCVTEQDSIVPAGEVSVTE
jgi:pyrimidine-specific ribonucleoside hydrolase